MTAPFPISPHYTSISLAYPNKRLIADRVLPRTQVEDMLFEYTSQTRVEDFTIPDTKVGRLGRPGVTHFSATSDSSACVEHAREGIIPQRDIDRSRQNKYAYDPRAKTTTRLTNILMLAREKRVSDLVFAAASYATANKVDVNATAADQWDNYTDSDPIAQIMEANDGLPVRANKLVVGRPVATKLQMHPAVVAAVLGNGGNAATGGIVGLDALAQVLGLDEIIVGESIYNTAKPGQTQSDSAIWGKHAALLYINPQAQPKDDITFGLTAEFETRWAAEWYDRNAGGSKGGVVVRVAENVKELVLCNDAGYFFENAID